MIKIFDASNSPERPVTRCLGGPRENDIVRYLKQWCSLFDCYFVGKWQDADVIFTNDVFPAEVVGNNIPLVKRMDGVYFQRDMQERNKQYNLAAQQADNVIFISEFSRWSYEQIVGKLPNCCVALNKSDPFDFSCKPMAGYPKLPRRFVAVATHWGRPEKRLNAILSLARNVDAEFYLVGTLPDITLPLNVISLGYQERYDSVLASMDGMICFAYRDAAPKTVNHGLVTGLPVLYCNSGGVPEQVSEKGIACPDPVSNAIEDNIPELDVNELVTCFQQYTKNYLELVETTKRYRAWDEFYSMLSIYFDVLSSF